MRILIIGNPASPYIYTFIKYTIMEMRPDEVFLADYTIGSDPSYNGYAGYYEQAGITVFSGHAKENIWKHLDDTYKNIKAIGHFDVCHIHSLNEISVLLGKIVGKFCAKVIVNYWGSDWLRADDRGRHLQEELLYVADYIVVDSHQIHREIEEYFDGIFNPKIRFVRFKVPVIEAIRKNGLDKAVRQEFIERYCIPSDKRIVALGYNGAPTQRHIELINAVKKMNREIQSRIFVVVPATYGSSPQYLMQVREQLRDADFSSLIIDEYLSIQDLVSLRSVVDIFINVQLTDAYASTLLEYTYLNKIVINGSWLDYSALEQAGAFYERISHVNELTETLENVIRDFDIEKSKFANNYKAVDRYQSPYEKNALWEEMYLESGRSNPESRRLRDSTSNRGTFLLTQLLNIYYLKRLLSAEKLAQKSTEWMQVNVYHTVIVYGAGHLGEIIYKMLRGAAGGTVHVSDTYQQNVDWYPSRLLSLEALMRIKADVVIITPVMHLQEIKDDFHGKLSCKVITIDEWIEEVENLG